MAKNILSIYAKIKSLKLKNMTLIMALVDLIAAG
jgi:hypothetical protein